MDDLRYPIGNFEYAGSLTAADRTACIERIAGGATEAPRRDARPLGHAARHTIPARRLDGAASRPSRSRQPSQRLHPLSARTHRAIAHHPPYDEARWAELPDARSAPIDLSLSLLDALHHRWVLLLRGLSPKDWARAYMHPEKGREQTLDEVLAMYAWHGEHHVAHVTSLRRRMGWN